MGYGIDIVEVMLGRYGEECLFCWCQYARSL